MKQSFVHCAEVMMEPGADPAAPGGAVTIALCGSWDHDGACRWPHETSAEWDKQRGRVRVVFVADAEEENQVRALIDLALAKGECVGPDGKLNRWEAMEQGTGVPSVGDKDFGARMTGASSVE